MREVEPLRVTPKDQATRPFLLLLCASLASIS